MEKGINVVDNPKSSKVDKAFLLSSKTTRLNSDSMQFQLLKVSLDNFLDNDNSLLTFGVIKNSFFFFCTELFKYPHPPSLRSN